MTKSLFKSCASSIVACLFLFSLSAHASTPITYVKTVATGTGDGSSWANATDNLAGAMASASSGSEIWVAQGTYYPTTCIGSCDDSDRNVSFQLKAGVTVAGGFLGTETNRLHADASNLTVLSGDIGTTGDATDNSYNVVLCTNCGTNAGLENFTISDAFANRSSSSSNDERGRSGGGLFLDGRNGAANPVVSSCTFSNNNVIGQGGAVSTAAFQGQTSPVFRFCTFTGNSSNGEGGACSFIGFGGTANPKFQDCSFESNRTVFDPSDTQAGGAVYLNSGGNNCVADFDRCIFNGNTADPDVTGGVNGNSSGNGGAIYATGGGNLVLTINNSTLSNNTAYSAGAVYVLNGTGNFTNVTVIGNRALGNGGSGGGIYTNGSTSNITNAILSDNLVVNNAGAVGELRFVNGTVNIDYTIVEAVDRAALFSRASTANSDVLNEGSNVQFGVDPELAFIAGFFQINAATSPAINTGDNTAAVTNGGDNRGAARIQQATVDLGAVESALAPLPVELLSFAAAPEATAVAVSWTVAAEIDLAGYRLVRNQDGASPVDVVFVPAMEQGRYAFLDRAVLPGETYYYQLISVDLDGTEHASDLVAVELTSSLEQVALVERIFPNPTAGNLTVELLPGQHERTVYATVLDEQGRRLRLFPLNTDGKHALDLSDLPNGTYFISLQSGAQTQSLPFVVER